jgi:hypothetical protein
MNELRQMPLMNEVRRCLLGMEGRSMANGHSHPWGTFQLAIATKRDVDDDR